MCGKDSQVKQARRKQTQLGETDFISKEKANSGSMIFWFEELFDIESVPSKVDQTTSRPVYKPVYVTGESNSAINNSKSCQGFPMEYHLIPLTKKSI